MLPQEPPECGVNLVMSLEDLCLKAYQDNRKKWKIGWGHTKGSHPGMTCTLDQAKCWLMQDIKDTWDMLRFRVKVDLTPQEAGALISFALDIGNDAFRDSLLLSVLNSGNKACVPVQMRMWDRIRLPDGTTERCRELAARREKEVALFLLNQFQLPIKSKATRNRNTLKRG